MCAGCRCRRELSRGTTRPHARRRAHDTRLLRLTPDTRLETCGLWLVGEPAVIYKTTLQKKPGRPSPKRQGRPHRPFPRTRPGEVTNRDGGARTLQADPQAPGNRLSLVRALSTSIGAGACHPALVLRLPAVDSCSSQRRLSPLSRNIGAIHEGRAARRWRTCSLVRSSRATRMRKLTRMPATSAWLRTLTHTT